ncbi:response regulator [Acetobacteraceae bacterium KSS8]|uniref:histidine kinase n=1 Tax=Endosaccharibacter trunci TaxID=2812733 RepID=A0ABT1WA58_9PROT|nr:response regulator [Acetobacteraceae bacterium KSS8]
MNAVQSVGPETLHRLSVMRSLPQVLRLLRENGTQAIDCDGLCLLLIEDGALRKRGCTGIDARLGALLVDPGGPAARALAENQTIMLRSPESECLLVPLAASGLRAALVACRRSAWSEAARRATERLAGAVADALNAASVVDSLPYLLFTVWPGGTVEPLGRVWAEYGFDPDEELPVPLRLAHLLHPDERRAFLPRWRAALQKGAPFEIEHRLLHRDGRYRWFRTRLVPIDPLLLGQGNDGAAFVGSSTEIDELVLARVRERHEREAMEQRLQAEITDRGLAEARLAKAERIEAVGQLTSGVAHDFNNLLTVIIGNIEFLEAASQQGEGLDARARDRLAAMREAAERGGNLTRQLLAFARRQRLEPRPTDLNDVVAELRLLLPPATGGGVAIETRLADGLWRAFVDRTQIERMILNLSFNAHDAMEVGGVIVIATRNRPLAPDASEALGLAAGDYVEISVSDTGRGMSPDVLAHAFEPFFTTKPPGKGSGLGLAQVYGFARQSGGTVTLQSAPGEGTTAAILLPRATEPIGQSAPADQPAGLEDAAPAGFVIPPVPALDAAEPAPAEAGKGARILLVDDDTAVREVTTTIVSEAGYTVIEASGGQEALLRLEEAGPVDLMITDYAMPGMNGHELWRAATSHQPDLKVLFVTGYADLTALADVPQRCLLLKPFRTALLLEKVAAALAG